MGKTSWAKYLSRQFGYVLFPEPDHMAEHIEEDISYWYQQQHRKRYARVIQELSKGEHVVLDRSILSSIAFSYARTGQLDEEYKADIQNILDLQDFVVAVLYAREDVVKKEIMAVRDITVRQAVSSNPMFLGHYISFYKDTLPSLLDHKVIDINVEIHGKRISLKTITLNLYAR